jgi:hypothetical protein
MERNEFHFIGDKFVVCINELLLEYAVNYSKHFLFALSGAGFM